MCEKQGITAVYYGETGDSAYHRMTEHLASIKNDDDGNAFAKHLKLHHPDHKGDHSVFKMESCRTFKKCLERQVAEGVAISSSKADLLLNSKAEFHQPAIQRVTVTREPPTRRVGIT